MNFEMFEACFCHRITKLKIYFFLIWHFWLFFLQFYEKSQSCEIYFDQELTPICEIALSEIKHFQISVWHWRRRLQHYQTLYWLWICGSEFSQPSQGNRTSACLQNDVWQMSIKFFAADQSFVSNRDHEIASVVISRSGKY